MVLLIFRTIFVCAWVNIDHAERYLFLSENFNYGSKNTWVVSRLTFFVALNPFLPIGNYSYQFLKTAKKNIKYIEKKFQRV